VFQSLIGRLRTISVKNNRSVIILFQSLIGRLRTFTTLLCHTNIS